MWDRRVDNNVIEVQRHVKEQVEDKSKFDNVIGKMRGHVDGQVEDKWEDR